LTRLPPCTHCPKQANHQKMPGHEAFSHENPPVTTPLLLSKRKRTLGAAYIRMRLRVKRLNVNSAPGHPLRAPHNRQGRPFLDGFSRVPVESKCTHLLESFGENAVITRFRGLYGKRAGQTPRSQQNARSGQTRSPGRAHPPEDERRDWHRRQTE